MKSEIFAKQTNGPHNFPALYGLIDCDIIVLCTSRTSGAVLRDEHQHNFAIGSVINPEAEGDWDEGDWVKMPTGFKITLTQE
jgi:hypothetical protein